MATKDIGLMIKLIHDAVKKVADKKLKTEEITLSQGRFLDYLFQREDLKTSQKDFENYFKITHPTAIGILNRLEEKNLITSKTDTIDKRRRLVFITPKGISLCNTMRAYWWQMEQDLTKGLTKAKKDELLETLTLLYENISELEE